MGMPSTKAECNAAIERKKGELAQAKLQLSAAKRSGNKNTISVADYGVRRLTSELADLKAYKATLKK